MVRLLPRHDQWYGHSLIVNPFSRIGSLQVDVWTGSAVQHSYVSATSTYNDGTWHHVAYTWTQSAFTVYVDGKKQHADDGNGAGLLSLCLDFRL